MTLAPYALINLAAIKHNIEKVRDYAPNAKIMAVIKANAYGHGLLRIAEVLNDVEAVAVARVCEGIQLRQSGFKKRITVLEGVVSEQELKDFTQYELDVVVHSVGQLDILEKYHGQKKLSVWLKLDTGMSRLGVSGTEFTSIYQRLLDCSCVNNPIFFMTHLSSADELDSSVTLQQIKCFEEKVKPYTEEKSIANSAGIMAWPDSISDWVRPGIMLYGVSPFSDSTGEMLGLKPVMSLHSRLISVKDIDASVAVGYAGTWVSEAKTKLGIVAIGYGDGYPRYAKTGTPVLVNGKRVPLVGRVSMDTITVDLNSQQNAKAGDPVTLWGDGLAIEEIAHYADTIPYTLLCGITQRVEKR
ncbi:MAG: alanine racemase [Methylomarinum sp.]|nr:alanine racemase [Methylomarinum sp.]